MSLAASAAVGARTALAALKERVTALLGRGPRSEALPIRDWVSVSSGQPARLLGFDQMMVCVVIALLALGLVMVYSTSIALPDDPRTARFAPTPHYLMVRHAFGLLIALGASLAVVQVPLRLWERWAPWLFVAALVLLVLVLIPHIGRASKGARRWIPLGFMSFQPSELAKLGIAMYAASYMVRKMEIKEHFTRAVAPMAVALAVIGVLLLAEPDMGAFLVIATIAMSILFLGGVNGRMFFLITAVLIGAFMLMISLSPWRRERIFAYLDPWNEKNALGKAYQLTHSLIAFGRGEILDRKSTV